MFSLKKVHSTLARLQFPHNAALLGCHQKFTISTSLLLLPTKLYTYYHSKQFFDDLGLLMLFSFEGFDLFSLI